MLSQFNIELFSNNSDSSILGNLQYDQYFVFYRIYVIFFLYGTHLLMYDKLIDILTRAPLPHLSNLTRT